ncbi:proline racemase family protein [Colwellia sp. MSW7]|uniref:Proline racemase family protein n=1 Tax=Colwellia maritima TaxID=2912588 RepID=A0ABS9WYC9_9GAMM|nr:proline racemase family protein [Colwellia maritima]MCI2282940.1 proline racemase family protein [Colwellia maritima]
MSQQTALLDTLDQWQPNAGNDEFLTINTLECHTGGEPLRIITSGFPELKGDTILAMRRDCQENHDELRRALIFEPRGHADMYGAIITKPERTDSHFGAIFIHNEGYSTMCGHAVIALAKCAVESGAVKQTGKVTSVAIDVPCGQIRAKALAQNFPNNKSITLVSFESVPAFVFAQAQSVEVVGLGTVNFDIAFGGAFYAYVNAADLGLTLTPEHQSKIIDYGKRFKAAVIKQITVKHPFEDDLSFLYGVIFVQESVQENENSPSTTEVHSRNVCIFADGELDRSPTGSGVSGRIALHVAKAEVPLQQSIVIESILGSQFSVEAIESIYYGNNEQRYNAVIAQVTGNAFICGKAQWLINKNDPLKNGFLLR